MKYTYIGTLQIKEYNEKLMEVAEELSMSVWHEDVVNIMLH
jgi:hypothetical protein